VKLLDACAHFGFVSGTNELLDELCRAVVEAQLFREAVVVVGDANFVTQAAGAHADEARLRILRAELKTWVNSPLRPFDFSYRTERVRQSWTMTPGLSHENPTVSEARLGVEQFVTPLQIPGGRVLGFLAVCRTPSGQSPVTEVIELLEIVAKHGTAHLMQRLQIDEWRKREQDADEKLHERTQELRIAQERFSRLANAVADIVVIADEQLTVTYLNEAFAGTLGYGREEFLGRNLRRMLEDFSTNAEELQALNRQLDPGDSGLRFTTLHVRVKDGGTRALHIRIAPLSGAHSGKGLLLVARDATDHAALFERLIASDRLAASGRAAATIAHEINNPLQAVLTQLGAIGNLPELPTEAREPIERIRGAVDRLRLLSRSLLTLAKPSPHHKERVDLHGAIDDALGLLRVQLQVAEIQVNSVFAAGSIVVEADREELQQMLLNLVLNAVEAMPRGGQLTLTTSAVRSWTELRVRDSGPGIPEDMRERMFEPFVTSKEHGSGLGLYICRGIATRHQARIELESTGSSGTTFVVRFPATE
jgi:PAS domain S-box-containing protein